MATMQKKSKKAVKKTPRSPAEPRKKVSGFAAAAKAFSGKEDGAKGFSEKVGGKPKAFRILDGLGMEPSAQQVEIFRDVWGGEGHTVVLARAGTGKSTTITKALRYVPENEEILLVAFNKKIAEELQRKVMGVKATIQTLHSFGYSALQKQLGRLRVDGDRMRGLIQAEFGSNWSTKEARATMQRLVSLSKGMLAADAKAVEEIADRFAITPNFASVGMKNVAQFYGKVVDLLEKSKQVNGTIDFDDMIYLPVALDVPVPRYDRVFVDETQDLNPAQLELVLKAVNPGGRVTAVGDDRQAIYGFRGADRNAVDNIIKRLNAKVLPLSITYRCPKAVVQVANRFVPDYVAAPEAPEGEVRRSEREQMLKEVTGGDAVLSRVNAPLVSMCLRLLREGRRAIIAGRDIGQGLISFINASRIPENGPDSVSLFLDYVSAWSEKEINRLAQQGRETQAVEDKAETLIALCEGARYLGDVIERITALFADITDDNVVVFSSTHKAKGLEWGRVFMLEDTYLKRREKQSDDAFKEEENLFYVAVTRAKKVLTFVSGKAADKPKEREEVDHSNCTVCGERIEIGQYTVGPEGPNDPPGLAHEECLGEKEV